MSHKHKKVRAAVRRDHAENYILTSLVAFVKSTQTSLFSFLCSD
jgi:hypothetical protein